MIEFLNDLSTFPEHPFAAAAFVLALAAWCQFLFNTTREFVANKFHGE